MAREGIALHSLATAHLPQLHLGPACPVPMKGVHLPMSSQLGLGLAPPLTSQLASKAVWSAMAVADVMERMLGVPRSLRLRGVPRAARRRCSSWPPNASMQRCGPDKSLPQAVLAHLPTVETVESSRTCPSITSTVLAVLVPATAAQRSIRFLPTIEEIR